MIRILFKQPTRIRRSQSTKSEKGGARVQSREKKVRLFVPFVPFGLMTMEMMKMMMMMMIASGGSAHRIHLFMRFSDDDCRK